MVTNVYCGGRHAASFNARLWSWLEKIRNDFSVECAFHLSVCQLAECAIDAPLNVPGTVSNVTTMAFVGWIVSAICHQLPWMVPSVAPIAQKRQNNLKLKIRKPFNGQYDALLLTSPKLGFMEMS